MRGGANGWNKEVFWAEEKGKPDGLNWKKRNKEGKKEANKSKRKGYGFGGNQKARGKGFGTEEEKGKGSFFFCFFLAHNIELHQKT